MANIVHFAFGTTNLGGQRIAFRAGATVAEAVTSGPSAVNSTAVSTQALADCRVTARSDNDGPVYVSVGPSATAAATTGYLLNPGTTLEILAAPEGSRGSVIDA